MIKIMGKCNYLIHIITSPPDIKDVKNDASAMLNGRLEVLKIKKQAKEHNIDFSLWLRQTIL